MRPSSYVPKGNHPTGESDHSAHDGGQQFRLTRLQTFNWGTFSGVADVRIPETGYLFVGPSGSGKSTLLDAHTALLTPPRWVDFNVAAREAERAGKDRTLMTYIRGAWAHQTADSGEQGVQYLRNGPTWTAIAETYRNGDGRCAVLAQVLWVRGNSCAPTDVKRLYLVLQREFHLKELAFFAESDFDVRKLKQGLGDAHIREEFSAYQERFRSLLGIESERALRLLHKTQSAKNLGELNLFLRDFMLDPPETFATAERLVNEFAELDGAHQAVVTARLQIETLGPARDLHGVLMGARREKSQLDEVDAGIDIYREQQKHALLTQSIERLGVEAQGAHEEAARLTMLVDDAYGALMQLKSQRDGLGGALAALEQQLKDAREEHTVRLTRRTRMADACRVIDAACPNTAPEFVRIVAQAKEHLARDGARRAELEQRADALKAQARETREEFEQACREIAAMERQPSNIPARMLELRADMARNLGIGADKLPFVGELIEVRKDASEWRGAIERVLHGFALSLLVDDKHYPAVSSYVNDHHFGGQRVVYYRVLPHDDRRRTLSQSSLVRKLQFAENPQVAWLREELSERFDYECADNMVAFRKASKALTQAGQVKHSHARHEKDDRSPVDDRRRWVLGFDNREKLALYRTRAGELGAELSELETRLAAMREEGERDQRAVRACQTLSDLTWSEVDADSIATRIESLRRQIECERAARPELETLDARIVQQEREHGLFKSRRDAEELRKQRLEGDRARQQRALTTLSSDCLAIALTPTQQQALHQRYAALGTALDLDNLDSVTRRVENMLNDEIKQLELKLERLRHDIEKRLSEFNRQWPAEAGGLDAALASADDYFVKLARLETDGLPRHEARFLQLLREQSDQNLTLLSTRLDLERGAIRDRLDVVNESLLSAPFNPGTHLVIESLDRSLEEVRQFKQSLKEALSHSFSVEDPALAEQRFLGLRALVKRLSSQETVDRNWRNLVLDVRQHVEFLARELDENDEEVEVYRSGSGKSGGQRQKLAAFCLAAALRYQLGGRDRSLPSFATVVLDEAFDKADAEFTAMAMNIFKTFGFQMIVATPLKSVMTLEPFIGGACFVHIKDRKSSAMLLIEYDQETRRLRFPEHVRHGQEAALS